MKTLRKYILFTFLKPFFQGLLAFVLIMIITHFFDYMHKFLSKKPSMGLLISYFLYRIPEWFVTMTPVATLLGILFALGALNRNNEITAVKSSGIKLTYIFKPIIIFSIFLSIGTGILYEAVVPKTTRRAEHLYRQITKKPQRYYDTERRNFTYLGKANTMYQIDHFKDKTITGLKIIEFLPNSFQEIKRLAAKQAVHNGTSWTLTDVTQRIFSTDTGETKTFKKFPNLELVLDEKPEDFQKPPILPEKMDIISLGKYIKKLDKGGLASTKEKVLFHYKISFPFSNTIILILGIPIALWGGLKSRTSGFFISLLTCFVYWGALSVGKALGGNGVLPPALGAWAANLVFLILSIFMMRFAKVI